MNLVKELSKIPEENWIFTLDSIKSLRRSN